MKGRAFSPMADARSFYWSGTHARAQAALDYGLMSGAAFTVLSGAPGTGKTSLLLHLMDTAEERLQFAMVRMPHAGVEGLSGWILQALGRDANADQPEIARYTALRETLINTYAEGGSTVLILDDAQDLTDGAMHELLRLTDLNTAQDQIVQIILSGHPPLLARLQSDTHVALNQRITARAHLDPLFAEDVGHYVTKRLADVEGPWDLFSHQAVAAIEKLTHGVPRLINHLCELSLVYLMTTDKPQVSTGLVQQIIADGRFVSPTTGKRSHLKVAVPGGMA